MAMYVYSVGGGEILYETFKAVAHCLNGGGGLRQAFLTVGGLCGAFMAYFMILHGNIEEVLKKWALPVIFMTHMFFIPTAHVVVHDVITNYTQNIDKVPYGLAVFASTVSRFGRAITDVTEMAFHLPDDMRYNKSGMVFGSDILSQAKEFKIVNADFRENMRNFVGQCVKYDIMLNHKYTFDDLRNASDIWGLVSENASQKRGIYWIPIGSKGRSEYVSCKEAVENFKNLWPAEEARASQTAGLKLFTGRLGYKTQPTSSSLTVGRNDPALRAIKTEMMLNLKSAYSYLGDLSADSDKVFRQNIMINAVNDAASRNSSAAGNLLSYSEQKALQQQKFSMMTVGRLAGKFLPCLKAVLEALIYSCFIFVIPLCMIPNGYKFLSKWIMSVMWLQMWAPMYAILNYVMNIAARASTLAQMGGAGGITIANVAGVTEANEMIQAIAGYLSILVPFICIAFVNGAGTFVQMASSMTGSTVQAGAGTAAEAVGGNFSYGNVSMGNRQFENISQLQRNFNSLLGVGGSRTDAGTEQMHTNIDGTQVFNRMTDSGPKDVSGTVSDSAEKRQMWQDSVQNANNAHVNYERTRALTETQIRSLAHSLSQSDAQTIANKYGVGLDKATQIQNVASKIDSYYNGRANSEGTTAGTGLSGGLGGGGTTGASVNTGINAVNNNTHGKTATANEENSFNESKREFATLAKDLSTSSTDDDVTRRSRELTQTVSDMNRYAEQEGFYRSEAKTYQESYSTGQSFTASERMNLRDAATKVGESQGYTKTQAARIVDSQRPEDRVLYNSWKEQAVKQEKTYPTRNMQQPNYVKLKDGNYIRGKMNDAETDMQTKFSKFDVDAQKSLRHDFKDAVESTVTDGVSEGKGQITNEREQIKNTGERVKQKEAKRNEDGAIVAAGKHTKNVFGGEDEKE